MASDAQDTAGLLLWLVVVKCGAGNTVAATRAVANRPLPAAGSVAGRMAWSGWPDDHIDENASGPIELQRQFESLIFEQRALQADHGEVWPAGAEHQVLAGADAERRDRLGFALIRGRRVQFHFGGDRAQYPHQPVRHVRP